MYNLYFSFPRGRYLGSALSSSNSLFILLLLSQTSRVIFSLVIFIIFILSILFLVWPILTAKV